ncbi:MAG: GNAT family N-acetyltransferase, partial [Merismopedia sp. SIO2A8]|nr:GNAT family N-acetyltransferase [Merismopedia sp. SIO2A8]
LGINPSHRQQGLGTLLLLTLLEIAIQRGAQWATLEVSARNKAAQSLYQNVGFLVVGRRKQYYKSTGEDALILWHKELQASSVHTKLGQIKAKTMQRIHQAGQQVHISGIPTIY